MTISCVSLKRGYVCHLKMFIVCYSSCLLSECVSMEFIQNCKCFYGTVRYLYLVDFADILVIKETCEGIVDIQKGQNLHSTVMPVTSDPIISDSQANGNCFKVSDVDNIQVSFFYKTLVTFACFKVRTVLIFHVIWNS